jgi:hypothetical protein
MELTEDLSIVARHVWGDSPHIDSAEKRNDAHGDLWRVGSLNVFAPLAPMTSDSNAAYRDIDLFRHVDVDVAEANEYCQRGSPTADFGLAQVEINSQNAPPATAQRDSLIRPRLTTLPKRIPVRRVARR